MPGKPEGPPPGEEDCRLTWGDGAGEDVALASRAGEEIESGLEGKAIPSRPQTRLCVLSRARDTA